LQDNIDESLLATKTSHNPEAEFTRFLQRREAVRQHTQAAQQRLSPQSNSPPLDEESAETVANTVEEKSSRLPKPPKESEWNDKEVISARTRVIELQHKLNELRNVASHRQELLEEKKQQLAAVESEEQVARPPDILSKLDRTTERMNVVQGQLDSALKHKKMLQTVKERMEYVCRNYQVRMKKMEKNLKETKLKVVEMYLLAKEIEQGSWVAEDHLALLRSDVVKEAKIRQEQLVARQQLWEDLLVSTLATEVEETNSGMKEEIRPLGHEDEFAAGMVDLERQFMKRASTEEALAWDRRQENRIVAAMERIATRMGSDARPSADEMLEYLSSLQERRGTLEAAREDLIDKTQRLNKTLETEQLRLKDLGMGVDHSPDGDNEKRQVGSRGESTRRTQVSKRRQNKASATIAAFQGWMLGLLGALDVSTLVMADTSDHEEWVAQSLAAVTHRLMQLQSVLEQRGVNTATSIEDQGGDFSPVSPSRRKAVRTMDPMAPAPPLSPPVFDATAGTVIDRPSVELRHPMWDDQLSEGTDSQEEDDLADDGMWRHGVRVLPEHVIAEKEKQLQQSVLVGSAEEDEEIPTEEATSRRRRKKLNEVDLYLQQVPRQPPIHISRTCQCCASGQEFDMSLHNNTAAMTAGSPSRRRHDSP